MQSIVDAAQLTNATDVKIHEARQLFSKVKEPFHAGFVEKEVFNSAKVKG